jgi:hypothetical protein
VIVSILLAALIWVIALALGFVVYQSAAGMDWHWSVSIPLALLPLATTFFFGVYGLFGAAIFTGVLQGVHLRLRGGASMQQVCWVAVTVALAVPPRPDGADKDKADAIARDLAEGLAKAIFARDVEAIMKLVDVPWCHDAREIINDREKVRGLFREAFAKSPDYSKAKAHVRKIGTLAAFRAAKKDPPSRQVSLGEVLGKDDRVVFMEIEHEGRFEPLWLGVRVKDGGKIVGFVD